MATIVVQFKKYKETKNTVRYDDGDPADPETICGSLYIKKRELQGTFGLPFPDAIQVTIEAKVTC
jgi:hypothetical protein